MNDVDTAATTEDGTPPPIATEDVAPAATDQAADAPPDHEVAIHRAICMTKGCAVKVTYRPTASGNGFAILERSGVEIDAAFGDGPNGRPVCPRCNDEMALADEQLPAAEAITQVAEKINPQPKLSLGVPNFNDAGALQHIFEKRHEIKAQEAKVEKSAERHKKDKGDLDELRTELGTMIDDYEERRQERLYEQERRARGINDPDDARLVRCAWEQRNPGQACLMCTQFIGSRRAAPASEQHAVEVRDFLARRAIEGQVTVLEGIGISVSVDHVGALSLDLQAELTAWIEDATSHLDERARWIAALPAGLGTPHVAAEGVTPDDDKTFEQHCTTCGARISDGDVVYATGALVGTDCAGGEKEPARQPRRHASKKVVGITEGAPKRGRRK